MSVRIKLRRRRRTKIIATLGPASSSPEMLARLFLGGADVFRLNFSHGSHEDHAERVRMIRALEEQTGRPIGILADVQGPKLRVGKFRAGRVHLQTGQGFRLDMSPNPGDTQRVQLPHPEILQAAGIGTSLLLDDGKLRLRVVHRRDDHLQCEVVVGGALSDRKGVNVPDVALPIPALTVKDRADLAFALGQGVDYIGLSFVQRPEDVAEAKEITAGRAWIMTKMEKPQALDNLDAILDVPGIDAIYVGPSDLGFSLGLPPVLDREEPAVLDILARLVRETGRRGIAAGIHCGTSAYAARAIGMGFNVDEMIRVLFAGNALPANQLLPPGVSGRVERIALLAAQASSNSGLSTSQSSRSAPRNATGDSRLPVWRTYTAPRSNGVSRRTFSSICWASVTGSRPPDS